MIKRVNFRVYMRREDSVDGADSQMYSVIFYALSNVASFVVIRAVSRRWRRTCILNVHLERAVR